MLPGNLEGRVTIDFILNIADKQIRKLFGLPSISFPIPRCISKCAMNVISSFSYATYYNGGVAMERKNMKRLI